MWLVWVTQGMPEAPPMTLLTAVKMGLLSVVKRMIDESPVPADDLLGAMGESASLWHHSLSFETCYII